MLPVPHTLAPASLFTFFFYCYGDHRDLHSFPTRRSSDLRNRRATDPIATGSRSGPCSTRTRSRDAEDRKSTRLNSSHLGISYAVFCLKKKKNKKRRTTVYTRVRQEVDDASGVSGEE